MPPKNACPSGTPTTRLVVVGDVHDQFDQQDVVALESLRPDLAVFVGDYGDENVPVVKLITQKAPDPKIVFLGNHDAWWSMPGRFTELPTALRTQLDLVAPNDVALGHRVVAGLAVVGGRPFSSGGPPEQCARFYQALYNKSSTDDFAADVHRQLQAAQATGWPIVLVNHNGPTGMGEAHEAVCGRDFEPQGGDHGDPDLERALESFHEGGGQLALCVFGHMHERLNRRVMRQRQEGRHFRRRVHLHHGAVYVNAAVVPRWLTVEALQRYIDKHGPASPPPPASNGGASRALEGAAQ